MTDEQIKRITELRERGLGYMRIAKILDISHNTVKSYCVRHGLGGVRFPIAAHDVHACKFCGKEVKQNPGRKEKLYCDDQCRMNYWCLNRDKIKRRAVYEYECPYCKKQFTAYGNSHRHYCSRACYFAARFGYRDYWDNKYNGDLLNSADYSTEMSG